MGVGERNQSECCVKQIYIPFLSYMGSKTLLGLIENMFCNGAVYLESV